MADPHAEARRAWYATQASQEDIEALVDERDALAAELASVRAQLRLSSKPLSPPRFKEGKR